MGKSYKAATSVGAVALVISASVMAAAPTFDGWTVSTGSIDGGACPTHYECAPALTDKGFYQRTMTDTVNEVTYFQTIITETNATANNQAELENLTFSDESFVQTGNVGGIQDKQRISDTTGGSLFKAATTLNSGSWAGDYMKITQNLEDTDNFRTDFFFAQEGNATTSSVTAKGMKITAYVPLQGTGSLNDRQDFVLVDVSGDYVTGSGSVNLKGPNGGTMSWVAGDRIQGIWVGQDLASTVGQEFGFEAYDNDPTTAGNKISRYSLTSMDPTAWDSLVWGDRNTTTPVNPFP